MKEDEITETYSTHGRNEKFIQILVGNLKVKDHLGDRGVEEIIILK
jgi:hypothetical protein